MKFYFISENKFYLSLLVLFFFTSQCVVTINASNSCNNTCSTCQNTLYYLKFRGSANCRLSLCPNQCMMISNQWNNDRLNHFSYFKENKINICETCFRAGLCHINDCLAEKAVIKDAINSSLNQITLHYLKENKDNFQLINKKSDSYFSNMSFIFNSLEKIGKIIKRYDNLYKNSIKMKFYFKKTIAHISKRNNVSLSDFDLGIDLDDEINTKGFSNKLKESQITFKALEIQKIHFKDDQLYISNEIQNDNIVLSRIINFDNLIKNLVDEGNKLKTKLKTSILKNLRNSEKLIKIISTLNKKGDSSLKKQKIFKKNEKKKKIVKKKEEKKKEITLEERKSSVSEVDNQVLKNSLAINLKKESKIIKEQKEKKKIIKNEKNKRIKNKIKKIKDKTIKKTNEHDQPIKNNKEKIAFNRKNIINEIKKTKDVKLNTHKVKSKKSKKERKNKTKKIKKDVEDKLLLIPFKEKKKKNEILKQNLENMLDNFFTKKKTEMYGKETINNKLDVMSKNEFSENKEKTLKNENKIDPPSKKQSFSSKKITLRKKDKNNKVLYKSSLLLDKTLNNSSKKKNEGNFINEQIFTEKKNLIKKIKKNNPHDLKFNPKKDVEKSSKKQCELERKSKQISKNIKLQK